MPAAAIDMIVAFRLPPPASPARGKIDRRAKPCHESLKADIGIGSEQEQLWARFANAVELNAKRIRQHQSTTGVATLHSLPTAPDALDLAFGTLEERLAALDAMRSTGKRLYAALSPAQRRKADRLLPLYCLPLSD